MPHRPIWHKIITAVGVLLAAVILVTLALPQLLVVQDAETGRIYMLSRCPDGTEFAVEFTHSVNLSPVIDTFRAENGEIHAVSAKFYAFGAGMPTELNPGEAFAFTEDGAMEITGISTTYDRLSYIVGTVFDYYLTIHGDVTNLRELCGRNAHVEIRLVGGWFHR